MSTNSLGPGGLTIQTLPDVINELLNGTINFPGFLAIYPGANVNPNSPDGQMINLFAQGKIDVLEFLNTIFTSFDPDQAFGSTLDQRCAINGVMRIPGTNTIQNITVTASGPVTLQGLDEYPSAPFTVSDPQGNDYNLITTSNLMTGANVLAFQAALLGPISSTVNTITTVNTVVANVSAVNNPTTYTTLGQAEETDVALRIRRANSVELPSQGYLQGLLAALYAVPGVVQALVLENNTGSTNAYGMPGHSIWVIVQGGAAAALASAIYIKRNLGCGQTNAGTGATATATESGGGVTAVAVGAGGTGYQNPPLVSFTGGGPGTGATAHAVLTAGVVTSIVVDTAGTGYTSAPTVVFNANTVVTPITQVDGTIFDIYFDTPVAETLWIKVAATAITGTAPSNATIRSLLASSLSYQIGQSADAGQIVEILRQTYPNVSFSAEQVSNVDSGYGSLIAPTGINYQFTVSTANIYVNGVLSP